MFKLLFFIFLLFNLNRFSLESDNLNDEEIFVLTKLQKILKDNGVSLEEILQEAQANQKPEIEQASLFDFSKQPDLNMDPGEMIKYRDYQYEEHYAVTEDCYILTMNRIINQNDPTPNKPPILLMHGILDSASGWIINTLGGRFDDNDYKNLGFALAKSGFDVWLGNFRGNTYSMRHTNFTSKDPRFWKFTYDNHALQDLPAQISKIQTITGYSQIAYVGYSQGTSTMFELLSLKPEVANVLSAYVALAPVTYAGNLTSPVRYLTKIPGAMKLLLYHNAPFFKNNLFFRIILALSCRSVSGIICENFINLFFGYSRDQLDNSRLPVYFNHLPAGTSIPNIVRFGQLIKNGKYEMLDYMSEEQNMICYNRKTPPPIPLKDITMPNMHIINGLQDKFGTVKDTEKLKAALKVNANFTTVNFKDFNHLDFILSKNGDRYINFDVISILQKTPPKMNEGVKLKHYTRDNCNPPDSSTFCHLNLDYLLDNIIA